VARYAGSTQRDLVGLGSGAQWRELPKKYPPYQTCHRRSSGGYGKANWKRSACARGAIARARELELEEGFIDASFTGAKRGPCGRAHQARQGHERSSPSALITVFLSPLVSKALRRTKASWSKSPRAKLLDELPERLIGDAAYDSDPWCLSAGNLRYRADRSSQSNRKRLTQTVARSAAIADVGAWNDSLPGCTGFVGW